MPLYDIYSGEELEIAEKIQQRRLQMLVHSYLYYAKDNSIVDDYKWSQWAMELVDLQTKYPDIAYTVPYANEFIDWNGSSGAFLSYDRPEIVSIAEILIRPKTVSKPRIILPVKQSLPSKQSTKLANKLVNKQKVSQRKLF